MRNLLVKDGASVVRLRLKFVLACHHFAHVEYQFFFDGVRVLSHSQSCRCQLVLGQLHAQALAQLYGIRDALNSLLLGRPRPENEPNELVVVRQHFVDWVVEVLIVHVHVLHDLYFSRWALVFHLWKELFRQDG